MLSDEDSTDSESGIRFKTASTRNKFANESSEKRSANNDRDRYSNRRDENQSSSRQNAHRSYRDRSRDRYDSRSRRERSRSREYRDEHRKKVHRKRSPECSNSLSSRRRDDEYKRSEKSSSRSKRENNSSRSRDNSHDRIHVEREKSRYCDDKTSVSHNRVSYKSLSDDDVKKRKKYESEYDSDSFGTTRLEKNPESDKEEYRHCRNTSPFAPSADGSPVDSPRSDIYSHYTNSPKRITITESEDSDSEKCGPIIPPQKNKHAKYSKKSEKNIEPISLSAKTNLKSGKKCSSKHMRTLSTQNNKSEQSDDTCYGPTLPPSKSNSDRDSNVNAKTALSPDIKKHKKSLAKSDDECYGPSLPALVKTDSESNDKPNKNQYGPVLPQHSKKQQSENESANEQIGPALPPQKKQNAKSPDDSDEEVQGPSLPTDLLKNNQDTAIGPALPPHLLKAKSNSITETKQSEDEDQDIGPTIPNAKKKENSDKTSQVIGPVLPPHLRAALLEEAENNTEIIQPVEDQSESEDDVIGPLPAGHSGKNPSYTQLEERALQLKIDSLNQSKDDRTVREEWMLELPQVRAANLGLGPRQFRAKGVPDMSDRSSWTDTPQDKAKKKVEPPEVDIKKEAELRMIQQRDLEQQKMVEKHKKKKKRDKSLLDVHQEEYNKKKKVIIATKFIIFF